MYIVSIHFMALTSPSARGYAGMSGIPGGAALAQPWRCNTLVADQRSARGALFAFATDGPAAPKAAAQASTGCGSEVTASQVNRLWESFQAQGLTELSRLPSVYLSLPAYPILSGQATWSDLFLSYKGP
jgi:hypothetical protein